VLCAVDLSIVDVGKSAPTAPPLERSIHPALLLAESA